MGNERTKGSYAIILKCNVFVVCLWKTKKREIEKRTHLTDKKSKTFSSRDIFIYMCVCICVSFKNTAKNWNKCNRLFRSSFFLQRLFHPEKKRKQNKITLKQKYYQYVLIIISISFTFFVLFVMFYSRQKKGSEKQPNIIKYGCTQRDMMMKIVIGNNNTNTRRTFPRPFFLTVNWYVRIFQIWYTLSQLHIG